MQNLENVLMKPLHLRRLQMKWKRLEKPVMRSKRVIFLESIADYLITVDNDILDIKYLNKTMIITIRDLKNELE